MSVMNKVLAVASAATAVAASDSFDTSKTYKNTGYQYLKDANTSYQAMSGNWKSDVLDVYVDASASDDKNVTKLLAAVQTACGTDCDSKDAITALTSTLKTLVSGDSSKECATASSSDAFECAPVAGTWSLTAYETVFKNTGDNLKATVDGSSKTDDIAFWKLDNANTALFYTTGMVDANSGRKPDTKGTACGGCEMCSSCSTSSSDDDNKKNSSCCGSSSSSSSDSDSNSSCFSCGSSDTKKNKGENFESFGNQTKDIVADQDTDSKAYKVSTDSKQAVKDAWAKFKTQMTNMATAINNFGSKAVSGADYSLITSDQKAYKGITSTLNNGNGCKMCGCTSDDPTSHLTVDNQVATNTICGCSACCCVMSTVIPAVIAGVLIVAGVFAGFCCCGSSDSGSSSAGFMTAAPQPAHHAGCNPIVLIVIVLVLVLVLASVMCLCCGGKRSSEEGEFLEEGMVEGEEALESQYGETTEA